MASIYTTLFGAILIVHLTWVAESVRNIQAENTLIWNSGVPIRSVIEYDFNVSWFKGAPNGIARQILGVNGQFPGPTVRGKKGDLLRVRVRNHIKTGLNLTIHWHGLHQAGTPFHDGTEQVTQCPLVLGQSQVYEFQLLQTGTHWWHAHHGPWRVDGLWGVLIVDNEPEVWGHLYQDEIIITVNDWYTKTGSELTDWYLSPDNPAGDAPISDSVLINGQGYYPCSEAIARGLECVQKPEAPLVLEVTEGNSYRLRLISAASAPIYGFSIDNHTLECIELDGVDTEMSGSVNTVDISTGMRYSFIVRMNVGREGSEFYIRVRQFNRTTDASTKSNALAILRYVNTINITTSKTIESESESLKPKELKTNVQVSLSETQHCLPFGHSPAPNYFDEQIVLTFEHIHKNDGSPIWTTSGVQYKIVSGEKPAIFRVLANEALPEHFNTYYTQGNGTIVQMVWNNRQDRGHPLHLHGHNFWIVGAGKPKDGDFLPAKHAHLLRTKVPKRDTTRVNPFSWTVIRYVANNPGVWLLHCHVNWHVPGGMGAVIVEGADILRARYQKIPKVALDVCKNARIKIERTAGRSCGYCRKSNEIFSMISLSCAIFSLLVITTPLFH